MTGLLSRTGLSLGIRLAGIACNFAALLVLARALDPVELGLWAWAIEAIALLCVVTGLGFNLLAVRVVPDCLIARDQAGLRRFLRAGLLAGLLASLGVAGVLLLAFRMDWLLPGIGADIVLAMAFLLPAFAALRFLQEVLRGSGRIVLAQVVEQLLWPLLLGLLAAGLWLAPSSGGGALELLLGVQSLVFGTAAFGLWLVSRGLARSMILPAQVSAAALRQWFSAGMPLALCAALSVLLNRGDLLALGLLDDVQAVAFYTPASRFAALLVLGQAAASMASAGHMRALWQRGQRAELQLCVDQMAAVSVLFALPLCLAFWLIPGPLLGLFGPEFVAAAGALQVLAMAQLVNCWTGPVACAVVACDLERAFTVVTVMATGVLLMLLAVLVPRWGMIGAACATLVALSMLNLTMAWAVWRRSGLVCWARPAGFVRLLGHFRRAAVAL